MRGAQTFWARNVTVLRHAGLSRLTRSWRALALRTSAASAVRRAALACVCTAPRLLGDRPSRLPVRVSGAAIVRQGRRCSWLATTSTSRATFSVHPAAPLLLPCGPSCLPIEEAICTIVGISRAWRQRGLHWRNKGDGRRRGRRAPQVVDPATPLMFVICPRALRTDRAVVRVNRPGRGWPCWWW